MRAAAVLGRNVAEFAIPPRLRPLFRRQLRAYTMSGRSVAGARYRATAWRAFDGLEFPVEVAVTRVPAEGQHELTGFVRDVTAEEAVERARINANAELERKVAERTAQLENALRDKDALLREKDVLLREVHHRVKNNLQVISSLLNLQLASEPGESTRRGLRESQRRIRSMALVHELLYQSKDFAHIDVGRYLRDLVVQLGQAYNMSQQRIATVVTAPSLPLDLDRAIPCGMLVNELVSNAFEHAFPEPRRGTIRVTLEQHAPMLQLTVADDGIGMASSPPERTPTFGLRIVKTLARQLGGQVEIPQGNGTTVRVTFTGAEADTR